MKEQCIPKLHPGPWKLWKIQPSHMPSSTYQLHTGFFTRTSASSINPLQQQWKAPKLGICRKSQHSGPPKTQLQRWTPINHLHVGHHKDKTLALLLTSRGSSPVPDLGKQPMGWPWATSWKPKPPQLNNPTMGTPKISIPNTMRKSTTNLLTRLPKKTLEPPPSPEIWRRVLTIGDDIEVATREL
jgi:hypothetical protein